MLVLRDVQKTDLAGLKRLAAVLNTVNLPNNEETLEAIIDKSVKSFAGKVKRSEEHTSELQSQSFPTRRSSDLWCMVPTPSGASPFKGCVPGTPCLSCVTSRRPTWPASSGSPPCSTR